MIILARFEGLDLETDVRVLLEQYFEVASAAPDGVKRLRELILSLAMQGKLVPQDSRDTPARELLKEIEAEKKRLIKEKKIKKSKPLPEITPEEIPYDLSESWEWVRFDKICSYIQRGKSPKYVEKSNFPVIAQKCIQWHGLELFKAKFICPESIHKYTEERFLKTGDLLWNSTGLGTLGRVGIYVHEENIYNKVVADSHVTVIRPLFIQSRFLYFWIASAFVQNEIEAKSSGSTKQIELATATVKNHLFPLPPLGEQHRIVKKIDRLMLQCDRLEKLREERDRKRLTMQTAASNQLLNAKGDREFGEAWDFIRNNFSELYAVKENVSELRKAILQLAVMGKLVPQDPSDRPASELLKEIEVEKKRLIKEKKIKKSKPLSEIKPDEIPYDLPASWEWVRLDRITSKITDGDHKTPPRISEGYRLLSAKNVRNGFLDFDNCDYISEAHYIKSRERCNPEYNDLLIVSVGGTIGRSSLVPKN